MVATTDQVTARRNPDIESSSLSTSMFFFEKRDHSSVVERFFDTEKVAGSVPVGPTFR